MEVVRRKWWIPLVPVSYYSAYKLTEIPPGHHQSDFIAPNQPQKVLNQTGMPISQFTVLSVTSTTEATSVLYSWFECSLDGSSIREEQFKTGHLLGEFIRLIRGNQSDVVGELQTSIVRYQEKSPNQLFNRKLQVDLVGIIHTGDERYYQKLQNRLRSYDCVLYEGVEVNSTDVEGVFFCKREINSQSQRADKLALVCQDNFLFEGQNWKHADLSWRTFVQLEEERQIRCKELENQQGRKIKIKRVLQIMLDFMKYLLSKYSFWMPVPAFVPLITHLTCSHNGPNAHDIDKLEEMFKLGFLNYYVEHPMFSAPSQPVYEYSADYEGDSDFTSKAVIIRERNKFAIEVLKKTIAEGKMSIAILYSVSHMADFHKRLVKELDMVPVTVEWYPAWFIKEGPKSKLIHPLLDKFQRENRTLILGTLIFSFLVADLCAWRSGFGLHYWAASWVFRFRYFFSKRRKERLEKLQHSISF